MKKIARRILLLTLLLMMAMSVHAMAEYRLYSQKTITLPNRYGGGWSNQFTLPIRSTVMVTISISGNNQYYLINQRMSYFLQNVSTGKRVYLTIPTADMGRSGYAMSAVMDRGTYSLGVYYTGTQQFKVQFSVAGAGGINIADNLEVMKGTTERENVTRSDGNTNFIKIKSAKSSQPGYATVTFSNSTNPPSITVKGIATNGSTGTNPPITITVTGEDGSYDTMSVKVTQFVPAPTLNVKSFKLSAGNIVYNAVENAVAGVTWSSSNNNVAKVNQNGRIKAIGYGKCVIRAKTVSNKKTYDLACTVSVSRTSPEFKIRFVSYNAKKKLMKIKIENKSRVPMVFLSKGGELRDRDTDKKIRSIQLKQGSSVTIPKKKSKTIYVKVKGKKLNPDEIENYYMKMAFKQDKRNYYAWFSKDVTLGAYSWKKAPDVLYSSYSIDK